MAFDATPNVVGLAQIQNHVRVTTMVQDGIDASGRLEKLGGVDGTFESIPANMDHEEASVAARRAFAAG